MRPKVQGPRFKVRNRQPCWTLDVGLWALLGAVFVTAAEIDLSKLPSAATRPVDFVADIKPIFETSCLRCHGTERPKGGFSLATRQSALKGGDDGSDLIPGDSAKSRLIHYVARLVPEMEMPPEGKGDPLTREQVGLLRAWIDQGVAWEDTTPKYSTHFSFAPAVRWVTVSGNAGKFQEHYWVRRGVSAGVSEFHLTENQTNGVSIVAEGHALTDDYKIRLDIRKPQVGFARFGFEQYRRYYDDHGPYYPFQARGFATQSPDIFALDRNLYLDVGKAFAQFGVNRPDWPEMVLSYEYQFKEGTKSTQEWGPVSQRSLGVVSTRHIFPAYKDIDEDTHILRFDVRKEVVGVRLEDNLRAEFSDFRSGRTAATEFPSGQLYPSALTLTSESQDQFQFANTLRGEKSVTDWLFLSAGYLYSRYDASATFEQTTVDGAGRAAAGTYWTGNNIVVEDEAHVFNVNALGGPWRHITAGVGVLGEVADQRGFGLVNNREGDPDDPLNPIEDEFGLASSRIDRGRVEENLFLRYTAIPATVVFAEAKLKQERSAKFEEFTGHHEFLRDTDTAIDWQEYQGGFEVSPWVWSSMHVSCKHRQRAADYDHERDEQPLGGGGRGYPAFITSRETENDIFETRLVLRATSWFKSSLTYRFANGDYRVGTDPVYVILNPANPPVLQTPGGRVFAGEQDVSTYSANVTLTPWRRWYFSGTLSYQQSTTWTAGNARPTVVPFDGDTYSIAASSTFLFSSRTEMTAGYNFSRARFSQNNFADGLPLGLDYDLHSVQVGLTHRLSTNVTTSVQYGFFQYDEPTSHGFNDYKAHMVFGTLAVRWP